MPGGRDGQGGKGAESESFSALLSRHLEAGTRPNLKPGAVGGTWTAGAFGKATQASDRTVRNWRSGGTLPDDRALGDILDALFGDDPRLAAEKRELREAWDAQHLRRPGAAGSPAVAASPQPKPIPRPTRWIGRKTDLDDLAAALLRGERAVLVHGPGGIGKTSLTQRVATEPAIEARFPRRAFVPLETAGTATDLGSAIAVSIGLDPAAPLAAVLARLRDQTTLLVLDNLETPWDADGEATEALLARCVNETDATLLASIRGDRRLTEPRWAEHPVRPFSDAEAAQLFRDLNPRIKEGDPHLLPLVRELGGMPLAIRLVAQRSAGLPRLEELWEEWQRQGVKLATDPSKAGGRLDSVERSIQLSLDAKRVRAGGWRLFRLLGQLPAGLAPKDRRALLPTIDFEAAEQLRDVGLAFEKDGRLDMLPPVRDFARRYHTPERGDAAAWARHFMAEACQSGRKLMSSGGADAVRRLAPEFPNLEAALRAAIARGDLKSAAEAAGVFCDLSLLTGSSGAILDELAAACRSRGERQGEAEATHNSARLALFRSDYERARTKFEEALLLHRESGHHDDEGFCIFGLAEIALSHGNQEAAHSGFTDALALLSASNNKSGEADCIFSLAKIALYRSDFEAARAGFENARGLYREVRSRLGESNCVFRLAELASKRGEDEAALTSFNEALILCREIGDRLGEANCITSIAEIALRRGDITVAERNFAAARQISETIGIILCQARCTLGLGAVAHARDQHDQARSMVTVALEIFRRISSRWNEADALRVLGDLERDLGRTGEAERCYRESEEAFLKIENVPEATVSRERREALNVTA